MPATIMVLNKKSLLYLLLLKLLLLVMLLHVIWRLCHSDAVPYVVQNGVVNGLADILDRPLLVGWSNAGLVTNSTSFCLLFARNCFEGKSMTPLGKDILLFRS